MRRREFIALAETTLAWPARALADTVRTVGILMAALETDPEPVRLLDVLRRSLAELGWREGANLKIELRSAHDEEARAKTYAQELKRGHVELGTC